MEYLLYSHMKFGNRHCSVHNSFVGTPFLVTMQEIFWAPIVCMNTFGVGTCLADVFFTLWRSI